MARSSIEQHSSPRRHSSVVLRRQRSSEKSLQISDIFIPTRNDDVDNDDDDTLDDSHTSSSTFRTSWLLQNTWKRGNHRRSPTTKRLLASGATSTSQQQHLLSSSKQFHQSSNSSSKYSSSSITDKLQPKQYAETTTTTMDRYFRLQQRKRQQQQLRPAPSRSTLQHAGTGLFWYTTLLLTLYPSIPLTLVHTYVVPLSPTVTTILSHLSILGLSNIVHARWTAWMWMVLLHDGLAMLGNKVLLRNARQQQYGHSILHRGMLVVSSLLSAGSLVWGWVLSSSDAAACRIARTLSIYTSIFMALCVLLLYGGVCVGNHQQQNRTSSR